MLMNESAGNKSMYKEHILELWKHPENYGKLHKASVEERVFNASCGDDITVYVLRKEGIVLDASFTGTGCALCIASASLTTQEVKGKKYSEVSIMKAEDVLNLLGVQVNPARLSCVLLALEAIQKSISKHAR
jgi:nitrogen fixation protein NifU and related proteins